MRRRPKLTAERFDLAFRGAVFRDELDALLKRHNARLTIGWDGKWVKLQVQFPEVATDEAMTILEATKGRAMRYVMQEEIALTKRLREIPFEG